MKPGWKTSEFWLTMAVHALTWFTAAGFLPEGHWAMKVAMIALSALTHAGYVHGRAMVKAAAK